MSKESQEPRRFHYKRTIILLTLLSIISLATLAYAAITITSDIDVFEVEPQLVGEIVYTPVQNRTLGTIFTFQGTVTYGGNPVTSETVSLMVRESAEIDFNYIASGPTDQDGKYSIDWEPPAIGVYYYYTTCDLTT